MEIDAYEDTRNDKLESRKVVKGRQRTFYEIDLANSRHYRNLYISQEIMSYELEELFECVENQNIKTFSMANAVFIFHMNKFGITNIQIQTLNSVSEKLETHVSSKIVNTFSMSSF